MANFRLVQGPVAPRVGSGLNNTVRTIRGIYETDPAVIAAMLPRPLIAAARPEIYFQFAQVQMHVSTEQTIEIGALTLGVNCKYKDTPGSYVYHMAMEGETVVTSGRERYGEPKKIAATTFKREGDKVRATCTRHGITYFEVEGTIGADNTGAKDFEEYMFCYKGLPSITTPGEFDGDVFLTRLNWKRNYSQRRDFDGAIKFHESAFDPVIDVPVRKMISLEYCEGATNTGGQILEIVPGEYIAPFWVQRNDDTSNAGIALELAEGCLMQDFAGRVAVVTGGANGVGRALCERLADQGAKVVIADVNQAKIDETVAEIGNADVIGIQTDVTSAESVDALAEQVFARFGNVHLLFNNAGVGLGESQRTIWSLPLNDWRWGIDVNVIGVINGIRSFVPRMLAAGEEGVVINTSSTNGGLRSLPNTPIYAATKAAVTSISEVLHQQLLREGGKVRAAILFPGPNVVNTGILASKRNRPDRYAGDGGNEPVVYETMQDLIRSTGLKMQLTEPEEVAEFALDGIRAGRFWLLPESDDNDALLQKRLDTILARQNPPSAW